ncbi:uncharacterized protein N7511_010666 [Penicillium nucicola]|uniref:uncharacterized protein n=1 Tax=Penicillium nucicola TaxID=1850975 RepID=UPI0025459D0C|nr:uncharacterized protein N7511_010666 [Penicillium nucicola]KAJ5748970.1 hypothetical protein N7511_010666 [Penicillium nucicola]
MASAQIQDLLRFLSQDAKLPLATAMGKTLELQKVNLLTAEQIAKADLKTLEDIFLDKKIAKQIHNAAKRISKKRGTSDDIKSSPQKRNKSSKPLKKDATPYEIESSMSLPDTAASENELNDTVIVTNRAPLVLAFAVCVLKYTMPEQPLSSRLSLAQAVVSANSRTKAVSLGLEEGNSAEQEGWGEGQPIVKVLGRDISVLKRWDYDPNEGKPLGEKKTEDKIESTEDEQTRMPPLWAVDLEALRVKYPSHNTGQHKNAGNTLSIFRPESARSYLYRAFSKPAEEGKSTAKKKSVTTIEDEKEECLGRLLSAIDMLCLSWVPKLDQAELDRRAWSWYIRVRPDVQSGVQGWGEKGQVKLSDILGLRRGI